MGINYYLIKPEKVCPTCHRTEGHDNQTYVHIDKSSGGWHFCFDGREHKTVEAWRAFIAKWVAEGGWIADEYHRDAASEETWKVQPEWFWSMVEAKRPSPECIVKFSNHWQKTE